MFNSITFVKVIDIIIERIGSRINEYRIITPSTHIVLYQVSLNKSFNIKKINNALTNGVVM